MSKLEMIIKTFLGFLVFLLEGGSLICIIRLQHNVIHSRDVQGVSFVDVFKCEPVSETFQK